MEDRLEQRQLWFVLSELFVDSRINYEQVASVAKSCSLGEVEFVLFERVAPVCISNMLAPIPPICWYFDKSKLVMDIEVLIERTKGGEPAPEGSMQLIACPVLRRVPGVRSGWIGLECC